MSSENVIKENQIETKAAVIIQRVWRKHIDVHVYKYYRDLINFKARGNPFDMLKCINPNEAKLLDAASGITVKFRLAGDRFPPNIYYKIFTNRPVQDLGANSPKDYTNIMTKQLTAKDKHNRSRLKELPLDDKSGWYKRTDNNGWRIVSDRLIQLSNDPVSLETSKKLYTFHHNKIQRQIDVEKRRKQKKIEWMQKMYKEGTLKAKSQDSDVINLVEDAVKGMISTIDANGLDVLEDWEVDELLNWTTGLDFDDYRNTWADLATSAPSQNLIEKRMKVSRNIFDPYELTMSSNPSQNTTSRQVTFD